MKKLSIVTICLNNKDSVRQTIESVIRQKTAQIEYVIVDGASSDGTTDIFAQYGESIDLVISEPDTGIYNAINKGIANCQGSLIGLMHAGDRYIGDIFAEIVSLHDVDPEAILYGAIKTMKNGVFSAVWGWNHNELVNGMIPHLGCFVPISVYRRYGMYDESYRIAADYDAFLRFYKAGVKFVFIDRIVCEFNLDGISSRSSLTAEETYKIKMRHKVIARARTSSLGQFKSWLKRLNRKIRKIANL